MKIDRSNAGALAGGAILIAFGLLSLASQFFPFVNWGFLWPFAIIGFGALFFVAMFLSGKEAAALAIPGSIIGGIGLVLLFQNLTHHWESMSYFWTLIIMFVGAGIYIMGWYADESSRKQSGIRVMKIGFILFIIFGAFFEMIFSSARNILFPLLLIGLGAYLVVTRSNLIKKHDSSSTSSDESLPPVS